MLFLTITLSGWFCSVYKHVIITSINKSCLLNSPPAPPLIIIPFLCCFSHSSFLRWLSSHTIVTFLQSSHSFLFSEGKKKLLAYITGESVDFCFTRNFHRLQRNHSALFLPLHLGTVPMCWLHDFPGQTSLLHTLGKMLPVTFQVPIVKQCVLQ